MDNDIFQYSTALPCEMCEEVVIELTEMMGIEFDRKKYDDAINYDGNDSRDVNNICILRDPNNKDRFIICVANDIYYHIIVRCSKEEHEVVKNYLLDKTNNRDEDTQENKFEDLINTYNTEDDAYKELLEFFNVDYI